MVSSILGLLILNVFPALLTGIVYWIESGDTNTLRIFLVGIFWPVFYFCLALKGIYYLLRVCGKYFRGKFLEDVKGLGQFKSQYSTELKAVEPKVIEQKLPTSSPPYRLGQWR